MKCVECSWQKFCAGYGLPAGDECWADGEPLEDSSNTHKFTSVVTVDSTKGGNKL